MDIQKMKIKEMIEKKEIQSVLELQKGKFYLFLIDEASIQADAGAVDSLLKDLETEGIRAIALFTDGENVIRIFELEKGEKR